MSESTYIGHVSTPLERASIALGTLLLSACPATAPVPSTALPPPIRPVAETVDQRGGLAIADDPFGDHAQRVVYLDQNWSPFETLWFYFADQGSTLLPYATLVHLEQPDSMAKFIAPANMARYRFLTQKRTPNNPDALPVGFARHSVKGGEDMVGLTCAGCHTGQFVYDGNAIRVDGAPALIDLYGFLAGIEAAMTATLADEAKLERFAAATEAKDTATARASLQRDLTWLRDYISTSTSSTAPGLGRVDAIGLIFNQVIRMTSGSQNSLDPNAPTSYPLLWDAPRHDYVQWTGFSSNAEAGSLGRNTGEVIGVFGDVDVVKYDTEEAAQAGYASSVQGHELVAMEESLRSLTSPQWPDTILPAVDSALAKQGAAIYTETCAGCHAPIVRDDPRRSVVAQVYGVDKVGTDPLAATNLVTARAPTGKLEGAWRADGQAGHYGATESVNTLVSDLVSGALRQNKAAALKAVTNAKLHGQDSSQKQGDYPAATDENPRADMLAYKARPLNGIWAASPYLHNGSVPTLYDLLLPPAERPTTFTVGRWTYDPKKVGYVTEGGPFTFDTRTPGNRNIGHEYGTTLSDADRWALVEYLKTL
ncbi:Cytochrome c [Enhygromyxa salina]|uniref:Cytochrome c n=1 Tax=Enhygromyxa salina TaxID=215803 RepID=A0A2S9YCI5_9BACT|nr:di-heme-cytochrome C peroxidase [Enhygromyxa salina]PRQ02824.1 Cytochrome c [Enhygromyxa salina]